jgi:hypothetical protein
LSPFTSAACGGAADDTSSSAGGSGGTDDTGGTAGSSDQSQSIPSASGFSISLSPANATEVPNLGGRTCYAGSTGAFTYMIGAPEPGHTVESGKDGVEVTCAVELDSDGNATFSGTITGADANGRKPVSFSAASDIDAGNAMPDATFTFVSPDTGPLTTLSGYPPCSLEAIGVLKSGAILTDIDCPLIGALDDDTSGCRVHGTIAFEYCATGRPPTAGGDPPTGS